MGKSKIKNPVAKNMNKFNKPSTHRDKKKDYNRKPKHVKSFRAFTAESVTTSELNAVEKLADRLFSKLNIDVSFTKHFKDRVNDSRNKPPIDADELKSMFKKAFYGAGTRISKMDKNSEAVLNDIQKDLNLPFVLKWDDKQNEFDLVSKTIMRKKDFKTPDKKLRF